MYWAKRRRVYLEVFESGSLPDNDVLISLIPTKDLGGSKPANYRPVSLLEVDCKILMETLARRLEEILPDIDQVGLLKNRESADNMWRLVHVTTYQNNLTTSVADALSLDAEKAFDRVEWWFLMYAMSTFEIGKDFCWCLKCLYSNQISSPDFADAILVVADMNEYLPILLTNNESYATLRIWDKLAQMPSASPFNPLDVLLQGLVFFKWIYSPKSIEK